MFHFPLQILYGPDGQLLKPESRRGRGKGRTSKVVTYDANGNPIRDGKRGRGRGRGGGPNPSAAARRSPIPFSEPPSKHMINEEPIPSAPRARL
ncbi:hypothetical protein quinque_002936 [Culex quinquefasciatus]